MYELIYTTVSRGLLLGRSGFCPVAWTQGMPANFIPLLDRMDSYIHQLPDQNPTQDEAAICYSCRHCTFGRKSLVLVSRIAAAGLDLQGKNNKIAHHFIFDDAQEYAALPDGGISVCMAEENFLSRWDQAPGLLPPFSPQTRSLSSSFAQQWESITGDAGWAGVIAEFFLRGMSPGFYVAYPPGTPDRILLELIAEIVRLLPKSRLPEFTFSTLFVQSPVNWDCFLRFSLTESALLLPLQQSKAKHFLSFTDPKPVPAEWEDWELVGQARKGLPSRKLQLINGRNVDEDLSVSPQVLALPGEVASDSSYMLKKSEETLTNFVTVDGENAAVVQSRYKRIMLCAAGILVLALIAGLGYYAFSLMSLEKALAEASGLVLPAVVLQAEEKRMIQPKVEIPAVSPVSMQELWHWYLAWQDKSVRIPLPSGLAEANRVSLRLGTLGMVADKLPFGWAELAVRRSEPGTILNVLPLRRAPELKNETAFEIIGDALPSQCLTVSIPDLQIVFPTEESSALIFPCHADVLEIEFRIGSDNWCWRPDFRPEFMSFLQRGQMVVHDWMAVYQPSPDEVRFGRDLEIRIGSLLAGDLPNFLLADWIRQWNLLVPHYAEFEQKLSLLRLKSKEEIRRFYPQARKRDYNPEEWDLLSQKISAILQTTSAAAANELPAEVTGFLEEAILMLYDFAFSVFYQENGARPEAVEKNDWKVKSQQVQLYFQDVAKVSSTETDQKTTLLQLRDTFEKLPQYSQRLQEYSQQAVDLNKSFAEIQQQKMTLSEKFHAFAELTHSAEFFQPYLESKQEIPFQQSQYQEFAASLNQKITYRWKEAENP